MKDLAIFLLSLSAWACMWVFAALGIGCGGGGDGDDSTAETQMTTENRTTGDCFFGELADGSVINLGPVDSEDSEQNAEDFMNSEKSTVIVNNCGGEVNVNTDDDVITTTSTVTTEE